MRDKRGIYLFLKVLIWWEHLLYKVNEFSTFKNPVHGSHHPGSPCLDELRLRHNDDIIFNNNTQSDLSKYHNSTLWAREWQNNTITSDIRSEMSYSLLHLICPYVIKESQSHSCCWTRCQDRDWAREKRGGE